jgi:hypothetical protein
MQPATLLNVIAHAGMLKHNEIANIPILTEIYISLFVAYKQLDFSLRVISSFLKI